MEYGSAFRRSEHYVTFQGTGGYIHIDLARPGVDVVGADGARETVLLHRSAEEDADRARQYGGGGGGPRGAGAVGGGGMAGGGGAAVVGGGRTDGAIVFGAPGQRTPLWLQGIIEEEVAYLHHLVCGGVPDPEFAALTDGTGALISIATAEALVRSLAEGRRVELAEVTGG